MQIYNNVQTPRFSPNFGKVRITREALNQLKDLNVSSMKMVEDITKAVEMCKDTEHFHINVDVVKNELRALIVSNPEAYFGLFKKDSTVFPVTKYGRDKNIVMLGYSKNGRTEDVYGVHRLNSFVNGETIYNTWDLSSLDSPKDISKLAKITVELDEQAKYVHEQEEMEKRDKEQDAKNLAAAVDKLKKML